MGLGRPRPGPLQLLGLRAVTSLLSGVAPALLPTCSQRVSAPTGPASEGHWPHWIVASPVAQTVKNPPEMQETLPWEDPLEKGKATRSRILAGESRGLRSLMGYSPRGHKYQTTERATLSRSRAALGPAPRLSRPSHLQ